MFVKKEQWEEWRNHPVTQVLEETIRQRVEEAKEVLVQSSDPDFDRLVKGMVRAFYEIQEWKPNLIENEEETDEISTRDTGISSNPETAY